MFVYTSPTNPTFPFIPTYPTSRKSARGEKIFPCLTAGLPVLRSIVFGVSGPKKISVLPDADRLGHSPELFRLLAISDRSSLSCTGQEQNKNFPFPALPRSDQGGVHFPARSGPDRMDYYPTGGRCDPLFGSCSLDTRGQATLFDRALLVGIASMHPRKPW